MPAGGPPWMRRPRADRGGRGRFGLELRADHVRQRKPFGLARIPAGSQASGTGRHPSGGGDPGCGGDLAGGGDPAGRRSLFPLEGPRRTDQDVERGARRHRDEGGRGARGGRARARAAPRQEARRPGSGLGRGRRERPRDERPGRRQGRFADRAPRGRADGRRSEPHRRAACPRQADRAGADQPPARPQFLRGAGPLRRAPALGVRSRPAAARGRRRGHRLRLHRRPARGRLRPGLHRAGRLVLRDPGAEGGTPARDRHVERPAGLRAARFGRGPDPGGHLEPGRLRRPVLAQHPGQRRRAADQPDARAVRRRRGLLARPDGLRGHGARQQLHVHHGSGRDPHRHRRRGGRRDAGRRRHARGRLRGGPLRGRRRERGLRRGPAPARLPPVQQPPRTRRSSRPSRVSSRTWPSSTT